MNSADAPATLVLACGALVNELQQIRSAGGPHFTLECLPAKLHLRPDRIPAELRRRLDRARGSYERVLIGYGDCGTAGEIDRVCRDYRDDFDLERVPGAHCYQFFAGQDRFTALHDQDPTIFWLTDYLARHFELFVIRALGIDAHPELAELYFGNYTRLIHLAQVDDAETDLAARDAAERLGLAHERIFTGYGELSSAVDFGSTRATDTTKPSAPARTALLADRDPHRRESHLATASRSVENR